MIALWREEDSIDYKRIVHSFIRDVGGMKDDRYQYRVCLLARVVRCQYLQLTVGPYFRTISIDSFYMKITKVSTRLDLLLDCCDTARTTDFTDKSLYTLYHESLLVYLFSSLCD